MRRNDTQKFASIVDFRGKEIAAASRDAHEYGLRIVSCHNLLTDKCHPTKGPFFGFRRIWKDILFRGASSFFLYKITTRRNARVLRLHFYNIENDDIGIVDISAQNGLDLVFQSGRYKDYSAVAYVEVDENGRFNIIETPDEALA